MADFLFFVFSGDVYFWTRFLGDLSTYGATGWCFVTSSWKGDVNKNSWQTFVLFRTKIPARQNGFSGFEYWEIFKVFGGHESCVMAKNADKKCLGHSLGRWKLKVTSYDFHKNSCQDCFFLDGGGFVSKIFLKIFYPPKL